MLNICDICEYMRYRMNALWKKQNKFSASPRANTRQSWAARPENSGFAECLEDTRQSDHNFADGLPRGLSVKSFLWKKNKKNGEISRRQSLCREPPHIRQSERQMTVAVSFAKCWRDTRQRLCRWPLTWQSAKISLLTCSLPTAAVDKAFAEC